MDDGTDECASSDHVHSVSEQQKDASIGSERNQLQHQTDRRHDLSTIAQFRIFCTSDACVSAEHLALRVNLPRVLAVMPPPAAWMRKVETSAMTKNLTSAVTGNMRQVLQTSSRPR